MLFKSYRFTLIVTYTLSDKSKIYCKLEVQQAKPSLLTLLTIGKTIEAMSYH